MMKGQRDVRSVKRYGRIKHKHMQQFKDLGYEIRTSDPYKDGSFDRFVLLEITDTGWTTEVDVITDNGYPFTSIDQAISGIVDRKIKKLSSNK